MKSSCTIVFRVNKTVTEKMLQIVQKESGKLIPVENSETCEFPGFEDHVVYFEDSAKLDGFLFNSFHIFGMNFYVIQIAINANPEEEAKKYQMDHMAHIWYQLVATIEKEKLNQYIGIAQRNNCFDNQTKCIENGEKYQVTIGFHSVTKMSHCLYSAYFHFGMGYSVCSITAVS